MKWKKIQKITKDYDVDALIILETFDSSSSFIDLGLITQRVKKNGKWVKIPKNKVALDIEVQAGWRVYDILNQKIIDEKRFIDRKKIESVGNSFLSEKKKKLPSLHSAVSDAAFFSGEQFYLRISPNYIIINREYYKNLKGIKGFKIKDDKSNYFFTNASKKFSQMIGKGQLKYGKNM